MEMQFYPPGWVKWPPGISCDSSRWCAALAIFSLSLDRNTGQTKNFGGSSTKEYGPLLLSVYPGPGFRPFHRYNNFRRILSANPCNAPSAQSFTSVGGPR